MTVLHRHSLLVITGLLYIAALHVKTTGAVSLVLLSPLPSPWNLYCRHVSSTIVYPAFDQEVNSFPGEMHVLPLCLCRKFACSFSCFISQSSSLAVLEVCKTPGSTMIRQISLGSFQCGCAVHLPLPCLPVSSWNCSKYDAKLVLLPVQIPCNRAMEMETSVLSLIRGNSGLCTSMYA